MKKNWKDIEGKGLRVDVGSTSSQAMSDSMPAEVLCFTTDGRIILNGMEFAPQANLIEDAINAEHPYVMGVVKTDSYKDNTPQILLDSSDCTRDDIDAFFEEYPLSEIYECVQKGMHLYSLYQSKSAKQYTHLDVVSCFESATRKKIVLRWFDGKHYYRTTLDNVYGYVTIQKVLELNGDTLQEQINEIKKLLQLA